VSDPQTEMWAPTPDPISARLEVLQFGFVAAFNAVAGGLAGVIWAALGTRATLLGSGRKLEYNPQSVKYLLSNDLRFALVALVAGIVLAVLLLAAGRDDWLGPGAVVGLAVGGVLGALVAAHVGHAIAGPRLIARAQRLAGGNVPTANIKAFVAPIQFKVNWWLGYAAWPFAAVAVFLTTISLRERSDPAQLPTADNAALQLGLRRTLGS
jgi:hypothetical protein